MEDLQEMMKEGNVKKNLGVLDLRGMESVEDLKKISAIKNVGMILISEEASKEFKSALAGIPMKNVGATYALPENANVNQISGQVKLSGEALANVKGNEKDILLVSGQVIITTPVKEVGYKQIIVSGQILAPRGSESPLSMAVSNLSGQIIYYAGENPRIFMGSESFSKEFFEYIKDPIYMLLMGSFRIEKDVSLEILKEKVLEITLMGTLAAPKELIPFLQALTTEKMGNISALENGMADEQQN